MRTLSSFAGLLPQGEEPGRQLQRWLEDVYPLRWHCVGINGAVSSLWKGNCWSMKITEGRR